MVFGNNTSTMNLLSILFWIAYFDVKRNFRCTRWLLKGLAYADKNLASRIEEVKV